MCHSLAYLTWDLFFIFYLLFSVLQQIPGSCKLVWCLFSLVNRRRTGRCLEGGRKGKPRIFNLHTVCLMRSIFQGLLSCPCLQLPSDRSAVVWGLSGWVCVPWSLVKLPPSFVNPSWWMVNRNCKQLAFLHHLLFGLSGITSPVYQILCIKFPLLSIVTSILPKSPDIPYLVQI